MKRQVHIDKAERFVASLERCGPDDWEARVEGAMLAATHWVNMALHEAGILPDDQDMIHTDYLTGADLIRLELVAPELVEAMHGIEDLRAPHVRGAHPGGREAGEKAIALLEVARREAFAVKPSEHPFLTYTPDDPGH
jgi:hypothetical protein